ncbi:hypothetical protein ACFSUK_10440 [Sphingobium scionense]
MSAAIAASTFSLVAARTTCSPLITRDTVMGDTPACFATSLMVGALRWRRELLASIRISGPSTWD